jgi:hypothetical protein
MLQSFDTHTKRQIAPSHSLLKSQASQEWHPPAGQLDRFQSALGNQAVLRMLDEAEPASQSHLNSLHGEPHGKKKSDDNGGEGVPDGMKQFNPAKPNEAATGSPADLATVEKPQKPEWDNGFDEDVAKRFSATRHESLADLGVKVAIDTTKNRRIQHLIVGGHGNKDMLATGSGDGPDTSDALNLKESNQKSWLPFFSRGKFYGSAQIWLMSCNVGNGPIPQLIADQSGSVVYAYTRTAYASEKSPWPETKK